MKFLARKSIFSILSVFVILFADFFLISIKATALDAQPIVQPTTPALTTPTINPDELLETEIEDGENTENENPDEDSINDEDSIDDEENLIEGKTICQDQSGALSWILCSALSVAGKAVDGIYQIIDELLIVHPISTDRESPVFLLWQYVRNITNIIFVIFMLIVIYSQITGFGISNYGIKRVLPRVIIAAVLVNLSYIITVLAVDVSNIVGSSLMDAFSEVQDAIHLTEDPIAQVSWSEMAAYFAGGATLAWAATVASGGVGHLLWMFAILIFGALLSALIGLLTIALRQGVILILIMIAPLAFVCYLLPNTERWFKKWKDLLFQMLIFFPMFSFLFGASKLASWAIITSADGSMFRILIGLGLRVLPLFMATSLLKMSGTILGKVSAALGTATKPIYGGVGNWANSHAEVARRRYLASNNTLNGSRLRNYLAYKQEMRNLKIDAGTRTFASRAKTRALLEASSYDGRSKDGLDQWKKKASKTTQLLKEASLQDTLASTAQKNLDNTLSEYGDIFESNLAGTKREKQSLGYQHGQAYYEAMMQQFRAENIAQGDQSFLLKGYLDAVKNHSRGNSTEFNRLIKNATGSLGHIGESTIMGQVLLRSSEIEGRRRREVGIVMNKFNIDKRGFRAMSLDKGAVNDDGVELDENGEKLEDMNYNFLSDEHAARSRKWNKYIARHVTTGQEIEKEAYDNLSDEEQKNYTRIRYMEIKDDKGDTIQRVYADDAAYMKEMLIKTIDVGDPINRRYNISYGTGDASTGTAPGILRQFHSTISAAMLDSRYKDHAAEVTPMLTSQANLGYINTIGQYHIANLQSLSVATKPGSFFQNDAYAINTWAALISSLTATEPGKRFDDLISDADIEGYRDVNGGHLKGLQLVTDQNGKKTWQEIAANQATTEQRRNFVKHSILPRAARKLTGMLNRNITPNMSENIKPDGYDAINNLAIALGNIGEENFNEALAFEDRLNPDNDIFDVKDYNTHRAVIANAQKNIQQAKANYTTSHPTPPPVRPHASQNNGGIPFGGTNDTNNSNAENSDLPLPNIVAPSSDSNNSNNSSPNSNPTLNNFNNQLQCSNDRNDYVANVSSAAHIMQQVKDILHSSNDFHAVSELLRSYAHNNPGLTAIAPEIDDIIDSIAYQYSQQAFNQSFGIIDNGEDQRLDQLREEITSYLNAYL